MRALASPSAGLLALAVAIAVLWEGGYGPASRIAFALAGVLALVAAAVEEPGRAARLARSPAVVVLWLLGLLGLLSAAWTIGLPGDAARWGLVTVGYGAVAVTGGVVATRPGGVRAIAAGIFRPNSVRFAATS